jgi:hypothetical protein
MSRAIGRFVVDNTESLLHSMCVGFILGVPIGAFVGGVCTAATWEPDPWRNDNKRRCIEESIWYTVYGAVVGSFVGFTFPVSIPMLVIIAYRKLE